MQSARSSTHIPTDSLIFGYGPMLPFVLAAIGAWALDNQWSAIVTVLGVIWGAMILVFVGGVRRGYGFGQPGASLSAALVMMMTYFVLGGLALLALIFVTPVVALSILVVGFLIVPVADARAAQHGDAPDYFAALRPPQMAIATVALLVLIAHVLMTGTSGSA